MAERIPQTLHSSMIVDFFYISKIAQFFDENAKPAIILTVMPGVINSDTTFLFVIRPFELLHIFFQSDPNFLIC